MRLLAIAVPALLAPALLTAPAAAQSVFDGTWKADPATADFGGKPTVRMLKGGSYTCTSCTPSYTVKADGAFHPITGNPYVDAVSVTQVDPSTVKFAYRRAGKVTGEETLTLSPDRATARFVGTDLSAANGTPVSYDVEETRIGAAPAGAHAMSGNWRAKAGGTISDAALTLSMKTSGDNMTISYPTGESVTARFGGPAAPVSGDPGKSMVKLVRTGASSFTSTQMRDGKVTSVAKVSVVPDGRTMTYDSANQQNGSTARFTATKQ